MLVSQLFTGDPLLESIAAGGDDRISRTQHATDPAVGKVQTALLIWNPNALPEHGADSKFGPETAAAVKQFKRDVLGTPAAQLFEDVGPATVLRLDEIAAAAEQPIDPPVDPTRVRLDIWRLQPTAATPWHPFVDAYERAVAVMMQSTTRPQSWTFQAAIHGAAAGPADPLLRQCQHGTWYFLPWHRMYLAQFEETVRDVIQTLPGVEDAVKTSWALPYWDYHRPAAGGQPGTAELPYPFREPLRPDGTTNHLYAVRSLGALPIADEMLDVSQWIGRALPFSGPLDATTTLTFGGEVTGFSHQAQLSGGTGRLEQWPHNNIHNAIGGLMLNPNTAGLDPVFWLHHANIDRLWEGWRRREGVGRDETATAYSRAEFPFLEPDGASVRRWRPEEVVDTEPLGYRYEDLIMPGQVFVRGLRVERRLIVPEEVPPLFPPEPPEVGRAGRPLERIGALDRTLRLRGGETPTIALPLEPVRARAAAPDEARGLFGRAGAEPTRYFIGVEHLTMQQESSRMYALYLDPDGDGELEPRFVGTLPLFGLDREDEPDAEHGLSVTFEITELVEDLVAADAWDPSLARVTFRIVGNAVEGTPDPEISIGSVNVFAG